jgi:hypothetical protein
MMDICQFKINTKIWTRGGCPHKNKHHKRLIVSLAFTNTQVLDLRLWQSVSYK